MNKLMITSLAILYSMAILVGFKNSEQEEPKDIAGAKVIDILKVDIEPIEIPEVEMPEPEPVIIEEPVIEETVEEVVVEPEVEATMDEIDLLALLTMAEAEGESEEGKRMVISTVLNRVDHPNYPDNITDVIYQSGQFTSMWNGRSDRCYVQEDIRKLVEEEMVSRTNYDVIYFTAGGYGNYGTPMFQVGNHFFCSY